MIKWTEITWYSRMASIVVFVGILPVVNFFIGVQYQQTQEALQNSVSKSDVISIPIVHQTKSKGISTTSSATLDQATSNIQ